VDDSSIRIADEGNRSPTDGGLPPLAAANRRELGLGGAPLPSTAGSPIVAAESARRRGRGAGGARARLAPAREVYRLVGKRRGTVPSSFDDHDEVVETAEPLEDRTLRRVSIGQALESLSPQERRLIELRYEADLTQPAVAKAMGLPEGTVKVKLHRIRKRLQGIMSEAA